MGYVRTCIQASYMLEPPNGYLQKRNTSKYHSYYCTAAVVPLRTEVAVSRETAPGREQ